MATKKTGTETKAEATIPGIAVGRFKVNIRGISPLIVHNFSEKSRKEMADKQQKVAQLKRAAKDPEAEFNNARYIVEGHDAVPAAAIKKAMMAGANFADMLKGQTGMNFFVRGDLGGGQYCTILDGDGLPYGTKKNPEMREDIVRIGGMTKTPDLRYRPEYSPWALSFTIEYNENFVTAAQLANLVNIAGFSVGLCEWRPQKGGGDYGRFEIADAEADRVAAE